MRPPFSLNRQARRLTLAAASLFLASSLWAQSAVQIGSASFPLQAQIGQQAVQLNGAGMRYKAVFKVYAAGLYLPQRSNKAQEVVDMPGPKRVTLVFMRDLDAKEFGNIMIQGVEANVSDRKLLGSAMPGLLRMGSIFSHYKKVENQEVVHFDLDADNTVHIRLRGKDEIVPGGEDFFKTILLVWMGPKPVELKLKNALLAGPQAATAAGQ